MMKCNATMRIGDRFWLAHVTLHCARTDEHDEHRAKILGRIRAWDRKAWWFADRAIVKRHRPYRGQLRA